MEQGATDAEVDITEARTLGALSADVKAAGAAPETSNVFGDAVAFSPDFDGDGEPERWIGNGDGFVTVLSCRDVARPGSTVAHAAVRLGAHKTTQLPPQLVQRMPTATNLGSSIAMLGDVDTVGGVKVAISASRDYARLNDGGDYGAVLILGTQPGRSVLAASVSGSPPSVGGSMDATVMQPAFTGAFDSVARVCQVGCASDCLNTRCDAGTCTAGYAVSAWTDEDCVIAIEGFDVSAATAAGDCSAGQVALLDIAVLGDGVDVFDTQLDLSAVSSTPSGLQLPFDVSRRTLSLAKTVDAGTHDFTMTARTAAGAGYIENMRGVVEWAAEAPTRPLCTRRYRASCRSSSRAERTRRTSPTTTSTRSRTRSHELWVFRLRASQSLAPPVQVATPQRRSPWTLRCRTCCSPTA